MAAEVQVSAKDVEVGEISPDGQPILTAVAPGDGAQPVTLVQDWTSALKK